MRACVRVCMCVCACMRACSRTRECVCVRACVYMCVGDQEKNNRKQFEKQENLKKHGSDYPRR